MPATSRVLPTRPSLSTAERAVFKVFREYLMRPGEMLCFSGAQASVKEKTLRDMTDRQLLVKEQFAGGYSLTTEGFRAMRSEAS